MARLSCYLGWIELLHGVDNQIHLLCNVVGVLCKPLW
jgi:hypothetical protein